MVWNILRWLIRLEKIIEEQLRERYWKNWDWKYLMLCWMIKKRDRWRCWCSISIFRVLKLKMVLGFFCARLLRIKELNFLNAHKLPPGAVGKKYCRLTRCKHTPPKQHPGTMTHNNNNDFTKTLKTYLWRCEMRCNRFLMFFRIQVLLKHKNQHNAFHNAFIFPIVKTVQNKTISFVHLAISKKVLIFLLTFTHKSCIM